MTALSRSFCLVVVFLLGGSAPLFADAKETLAKFRASFEKRMNSELDEHGKAARDLRTKYIDALKKLKIELGRAENLKGAAQVVAEIEAVEDGEEAKELPKGADPKFKRLREQWERGLVGIRKDRTKKITTTVALYLKAIDTEKRRLTRAGKIKDALLFEEEEKRVAELPEVKAAMAKGEPEVVGPAGPEDLEAYLPGKTFTYHREGRGSRKLKFEEKSKGYFVDDPKTVLRWRLRRGSRTVVLTHRDFTADVELVFAEDGKSYDGKLLGIGRRWGELVPSE